MPQRKRWKSFEMPTRMAPERETLTAQYGMFIAEPFERGFATTIGNSFRRVLLSSLEGAAITNVRIEGVPHQYTTIPGVVEDVTDIILNIKQVRLRMDCESATVKTLTLSVTDTGEITAGMIQTDPDVTVLNKDLVLFTVTQEDTPVEITMECRRGRGYAAAAENDPREIGVIAIDSLFSPVTRVRYRAEDTRVGQMTNFDRLVLDVWTDGSISPEEAIVEAAKILRRHLDPFVQYQDIGREMPGEAAAKADTEADAGPGGEETSEDADLRETLALPIDSLGLSVRASNCLDTQGIKTVGELVHVAEAELLAMRNLGKTSLDDIKQKLAAMGLAIGMQIEQPISEGTE